MLFRIVIHAPRRQLVLSNPFKKVCMKYVHQKINTSFIGHLTFFLGDCPKPSNDRENMSSSLSVESLKGSGSVALSVRPSPL